MNGLRVFGPPAQANFPARTMVHDQPDGVVRRLLIGESAAIRSLRESILRVGPTSLPVSIIGPTGVGKELVAEALHLVSKRSGRFVPFNVCAISEPMFEDALFGHVRGAFTGAIADAAGYLLEANAGTAFFDEIGSLSLAMQAKLLRAVENKRFRPVGGSSDRNSDFRVLCATNENLPSLVRNGRFRSDLAFRLGGVTLEVPSLDARKEDIPLLVRSFLMQQGAAESHFSECAMDALTAHSWHGNVRELRHVVELLVQLSGGGQVGRRDVSLVLRNDVMAGPAAHADGERRHLHEVLDDADWSVAVAAQTLGIHPTTLYRRLCRLGIQLKARSTVDSLGCSPG